MSIHGEGFKSDGGGFAFLHINGKKYAAEEIENRMTSLAAANERIRELEAEAKMPGKCARAIAPLLEDLAAERAVSDRLLEALKMVSLTRRIEGIEHAIKLIAEVEAMRKEQE